MGSDREALGYRIIRTSIPGGLMFLFSGDIAFLHCSPEDEPWFLLVAETLAVVGRTGQIYSYPPVQETMLPALTTACHRADRLFFTGLNLFRGSPKLLVTRLKCLTHGVRN